MTIAEDSTSPTDASVGGLAASRISRRAAMKAAVGGAVAAGVFIAPRVEGFSLVPDYASATSGNDSSESQTISTLTSQSGTAAFCLLKCCVTCWNSTGVATRCSGNSLCTCGNAITNSSGVHKTCGDSTTDYVAGSFTVPKNSPAGTFINMNYKLWGPTEGCTNQTPTLNYVLAGISSHYQSCNVNVTASPDASPSSPAFNGNYNVNHTANGSYSATSPAYTGSLDSNLPAAGRCAAPADLTITLACTFL